MKLAEDEQELLRADLAHLLRSVPEGELRHGYVALAECVETGEIPEERVRALEGLLSVGLESGRTRALHSAHGEMTAQKLFQRTPRGQALQRSAREVSQALQALEGQSIEEVSVTVAGPSSFAVSLGTDRGRVLLRFDRNGVRIQSLEVGA